MKKIYFLVNLHSGKGAIGDMLGDIIDTFCKAGVEVTVHSTQSSEDAEASAKRAGEEGYDAIVCAGGDGTLSLGINGILNSSRIIPVGYIPSGSTNDFARTIGAPKNMMSAVEWIISGTPVYCDIGRLNDRYFTYIAAFGAFTNVTYETPQQVKNIFGHSAYVVNALMNITGIHSHKLRIEYGDTVLEDEFIFGMVTNASSVAGLLSLNKFLLDDGLFEVVLVKKPSSIIQLQGIIRSLLNISGEIDKEYIRIFNTEKITFTSLTDEELEWTRDGEFGGKSMVSVVENCPRAVPFILGERNEQNFIEDKQI